MIHVVGSINVDLSARVPRLPQAGETLTATEFIVSPGGKGANQAVAAARAGGNVAMIGRVGADTFREPALNGLTAAGVDVTYVSVERQRSTGTALIVVDGQGENSIVVVPGANAAVSPADVDAAFRRLPAATCLLLQGEIPAATSIHAARAAARNGARVLLSAAPAANIDRAIFSLVDILILNESEVGELTGVGAPIEPALAARMLLDAGVHTVIVTLGARGAVIVGAGGEQELPAVPVEAVDTVGAGDAFAGNLAAALDRGEDLTAAVGWAQAAAAWSVTVRGAQQGMPSAEETESMLRGSP